MPFIAVEITIQQPARRLLTVADAPSAHAAVLHAISTVDAAVGQRLHDAQRDKRLTIALIDPSPACQNATCLRVVVLANEEQDDTRVVLEALSCQRTLPLGRATVEVQGVAVNGTPWSGVATWADLLQEPSEPAMRFEFVTPTAMMKRDDNGGRFSSLLPDPTDLFRGLARRWRGLDGPPLPATLDTFLQTGGCVIAHHRLRTVAFRTPERTQIGFIGHVTYQCRKPAPDCVAALNALARLAFFTGVGYQTARGMGLVHTTVGRER